MIITSDILRGFFRSQQQDGDSNTTVPPMLLPVLEVPSPLGQAVILQKAIPWPQNDVVDQSTIFSFGDTNVGAVAGQSYRFAGLEQGLWHLYFDSNVRNATAMGGVRYTEWQISFDQSVFVMFSINDSEGVAAGTVGKKVWQWRLSLQKRMYINISMPTTLAGETVQVQNYMLANRLQ